MKLKPIPGWEELYAVTKCGKVWSYRSNRWLSLHKKNGYDACHLHRDGRRVGAYVHRLILSAWNGEPRKGEVCRHLDGSKSNTSELRWGTHSENSADKVKHGRVYRPAKLTEEQVLDIRSRLGTDSQSQLAKEFGVSRTTISAISTGRNWSHV